MLKEHNAATTASSALCKIYAIKYTLHFVKNAHVFFFFVFVATFLPKFLLNAF
jgi:hypothetical protein